MDVANGEGRPSTEEDVGGTSRRAARAVCLLRTAAAAPLGTPAIRRPAQQQQQPAPAAPLL